MKYVLIAILLFICSCSDEISGTQTGNPATISLIYTLDTTSAPKEFNRASGISKITISSVHVVISEIRLDGKDDSLIFRQKTPYILSLNSGTNFLDSATTTRGSIFEELELRVEKLDTTIDSLSLKEQSIKVQGILMDTTPFTFYSDLSEKIRIGNPITIDKDTTSLLLDFDILTWFWDEKNNTYFDPNNKDNKSDIENNIKKSFSLN